MTDDPADALYIRAVALVLRHRRVSTTFLQRHFSNDGYILGYNRCALFLARMEIEGIVGRIDSDLRRDVLARLQ